MVWMPDDLQSDPQGPSERLAVKSLQTMDLVRRQLDRIAYLRSIRSPWGPAVEHLRDTLVGLEDEQFWDGIPPTVRLKVKKLESDPGDRRSVNEAKALRQQWAPHGWNGLPIRAVPVRIRIQDPVTGQGRVVVRARFLPTAENLSDMLRVMMQLLHRRGLLWKTRGLSALPGLEEIAPLDEEGHA